MPAGNAPTSVPEGVGQTLLHVLSDPTHYSFFKAADFWLGAVGFIITLIGFWVAARRLAKVETAAAAAETAVKNFKFRINRYDATTDVSSARYALSIIETTADKEDWRTVGDAMTHVRHAISRLSTLVTKMDKDLGRDLANASNKFEKLIISIDRSREPGNQQPDKVNVKKVCRATVDVFYRAQHLLEEKAP